MQSSATSLGEKAFYIATYILAVDRHRRQKQNSQKTRSMMTKKKKWRKKTRNHSKTSNNVINIQVNYRGARDV